MCICPRRPAEHTRKSTPSQSTSRLWWHFTTNFCRLLRRSQLFRIFRKMNLKHLVEKYRIEIESNIWFGCSTLMFGSRFLTIIWILSRTHACWPAFSATLSMNNIGKKRSSRCILPKSSTKEGRSPISSKKLRKSCLRISAWRTWKPTQS